MRNGKGKGENEGGVVGNKEGGGRVNEEGGR